MHVLTDRYAFISVHMQVHIMNIHGVGPCTVLTNWPIVNINRDDKISCMAR